MFICVAFIEFESSKNGHNWANFEVIAPRFCMIADLVGEHEHMVRSVIVAKTTTIRKTTTSRATSVARMETASIAIYCRAGQSKRC